MSGVILPAEKRNSQPSEQQLAEYDSILITADYTSLGKLYIHKKNPDQISFVAFLGVPVLAMGRDPQAKHLFNISFDKDNTIQVDLNNLPKKNPLDDIFKLLFDKDSSY